MTKPLHEKRFLDLRGRVQEVNAMPADAFPLGVRTIMSTPRELQELLDALDEARANATKWPNEGHLS